jgi:Holliday junction resolvase
LVSKAYRKGYSLERFCCLTLEYNGFHVKRNTLSLGIEDVIAFNGDMVYLIQCKNTKLKDKSMSKSELEILKLHAKDLGAIPIYLYKDGRGRYVWQGVFTGINLHFNAYTPMWYKNRQKIRKELKRLKKSSLPAYNKYVIENWKDVKEYVC